MQQKTERKLVWTNTAVVCLVALLCCFCGAVLFRASRSVMGFLTFRGSRPDYRSFLPELDFSWQESWRW